MKSKTRITSFLSAVCLVGGLMTTTAFAAGGGAQDSGAIVFGTSAINDPIEITDSNGKYYTPNSYIYFGVNESTPIKWRVLDADKANDGTTSGMFLLSEYLLADNVQFDTDSNTWQNSEAQVWCASFAEDTNIFSMPEQNAMAGVAKSDVAENSLYETSWGTSELKATDKMFFLSARELADYVGDYDSAPGLIAKWNEYGNPGEWWLRSPDALMGYNAGTVNFEGIADVMIVPLEWAARPAFNLNLDSVLFVSAAEGGKVPVGEADNALFKIPAATTTEWKLTLLDSSRNFKISSEEAEAAPGGKIRLDYTGAEIYDAANAPNEYISVVITDNSGLLYYGRVAQPVSASGIVEFTVPDDLASGNYTLKIFNEQYNGGNADDTKLTDYASDFSEVSLTVDPDAGDDDQHTHSGGTATCESPATCTACGEVYGEKDATNHAGGEEVRNAKEATATEEGYTGDTYCKGCGAKIKTGTAIPVTGSSEKPHTHSGGTATCESPATCTACGEAYGEKDATNHAGGEEVRNAKEATATEEGYTGDTYCKGCGVRLVTGVVVPATGSSVDSDDNNNESSEDNNNEADSDNNNYDNSNNGLDDSSSAEYEDKSNEVPSTGDNSMIGLWAILATACLLMIFTVFFFKKGKYQN